MISQHEVTYLHNKSLYHRSQQPGDKTYQETSQTMRHLLDLYKRGEKSFVGKAKLAVERGYLTPSNEAKILKLLKE